MSTNTTLQANHMLTMKSGPAELFISNLGSSNADYKITIGKNPIEEQNLSGPGSMQSYEGVTYPVEIDNFGPDSIQVK